MSFAEEYPYWMAFVHLPGWQTERINQLSVDLIEHRNLSLPEFFGLSAEGWQRDFGLTEAEIEDVEQAAASLAEYEALAKKLRRYEIELLPYASEQYPPTLKLYLPITDAPPLLYAKGELSLLQEPATAMIGSHKASAGSLEFTRNIARRCAENGEVVVSGFAKGIERTALDETLTAGGRGILVLSQGILTFSMGFKQYYEPILAGDLLVCSAFPPKSRWGGISLPISALADAIYVAEANFEGGLWAELTDALAQQRVVYVRQPEEHERNANQVLIAQGAVPVDMQGNP